MNFYKRLMGFWNSDRSLTALLVFLILMIFVIPSSTSFEGWRDRVLGIVMTLALLAGIRVASKNRFQAILLSVFVVIALVFRALSFMSQGQLVFVLRAVSNIVSLVTLVIVVTFQVFREGPITIHRIQGAVAEYLLLGLIWASAYELVEVLIPGAILSGGLPIPAHSLVPSMIYYSFVTLTTVGYGDLTPAHEITRSLAIMEALTGQLFPAILIARLVSMELLSSRKNHS